MSAQLDQLLSPRQLRECQATDAALSATILQAVAPRPINLAHVVGRELAKGLTEPNEVADLIEQISDRIDRRFNALDDCAENQALIEVLYEVGETLRQARLRFVALDALCEGVTL